MRLEGERTTTQNIKDFTMSLWTVNQIVYNFKAREMSKDLWTSGGK